MYPGGILNFPMPWNATRPQWRDTMRSRAFPRIDKFKPDLIFISAGFDAHEKEDLSYGFSKFIEYDYSWMTKEIKKLANLHSEGRVISVLEGGYNVKGGLQSPLAQSVSFHVAELRSRSKQIYKERNIRELEDLAELDQKNEQKRLKINETTRHERVKRFKRPRTEITSNLVDLDPNPPAEKIEERNLTNGQEAREDRKSVV